MIIRQGIEITNYARNKNVKVILITDSELAPNAEKVNLAFLVKHKKLSFLINIIPLPML